MLKPLLWKNFTNGIDDNIPKNAPAKLGFPKVKIIPVCKPVQGSGSIPAICKYPYTLAMINADSKLLINLLRLIWSLELSKKITLNARKVATPKFLW